MLDQSTIDKIHDAAVIQDVVSDYVTLRKRGVNLIGLCPFHNEKTPHSVCRLQKVFSNASGAVKVVTLCILLWSMSSSTTTRR